MARKMYVGFDNSVSNGDLSHASAVPLSSEPQESADGQPPPVGFRFERSAKTAR